ncbi:acyl-ACP desaturase [Streptomyces bambusae]|uniref:Acyl-ACP desaturase n=1 Tax=Streptomyces bambusae TaxID=1550616 RepID=A0ABS6ZA00_9ACTN|nr:acyl-ACP desaturase [Streptomyces bambusae]MBW5484612.1 acyl-ACP desaturase [Streptomyces bambusae]
MHIPDSGILDSLEEVVERELNRHLASAREWFPHEYVPWSRGRDYDGPLAGSVWSPEDSPVSRASRTALVVNLLTEDNLPSYHHELAAALGRDNVWGEWLHRWTAEEARHSIVIRDYLLASRAVDPVALERARMQHMSHQSRGDEGGVLDSIAYVTIQELATRVSHRNTGQLAEDPVCDRILARVAMDENLHMVFYRNVLDASFSLSPDQAMQALKDVVIGFHMPGRGMPGFERASANMALDGIYNLHIHLEEVVQPLLRKLNVLYRTDLGPQGRRDQDELGTFLAAAAEQARAFEDRRAAILTRRTAHA